MQPTRENPTYNQLDAHQFIVKQRIGSIAI